MKIQDLLLPAAAAALAPAASAQITFSFDFQGPSRSAPSCAGAIMTEGDILTPCPTTVPMLPLVPGLLPPPLVAIPSGPFGLGLPGLCVGAPPGVLCMPGLEVDALSYGADGPIDPQIFIPGTNFVRKARYHFSVDRFAVGAAGMIPPTVFTEAGSLDAACDVFMDIGFLVPPPFMPFGGMRPGNVARVDGDGRPQLPSYWAYPGTGLIEPSPAGPPPTLGDNLDALDADGTAAGAAFPVYFSLDSPFPDPRTGFPNTGSAPALGFSGADVLITPVPGGPPFVFAPAGLLGLDLIGGFSSDDLDALILFENGSGAFEPSFMPYDWIFGPGPHDMLLFSVRTGSAVLGAPDSRYGIPIQAGDTLGPPVPTPFGGVSPFPSIWIPAEDLGLSVNFLRGGVGPFGDDIDALDYSRQKQSLVHEYCYGDGGILGCTGCPCGNDMPAGTQTGCKNSAGTGARLNASGMACITADTLRFEVTGAVPISFAILVTGTTRLPAAGFCPPGSGIAPLNLDGLRCIGGNQLRYAARPTDINGDVGITNAGWGPPNGPPRRVLAYAGDGVPCLTTQWQVLYRENAAMVCMKGVNTTQGVQVVTQP